MLVPVVLESELEERVSAVALVEVWVLVPVVLESALVERVSVAGLVAEWDPERVHWVEM